MLINSELLLQDLWQLRELLERSLQQFELLRQLMWLIQQLLRLINITQLQRQLIIKFMQPIHQQQLKSLKLNRHQQQLIQVENQLIQQHH